MKNFIKKILPNFLLNYIKKLIFKKHSKILNNIEGNFKNITYNNKANILSELCEKYGSDKGFVNHNEKKPYNWQPHTYTSYYHSIFNLSRDNIRHVFECGIGTNNPNIKSNMTNSGMPGASLRVWRDYFSNANIYGGDVDKNILFEEERIKTFYVDQLNADSIKSMWKKIEVENFDIIIDDGLHEPEANINFFVNSFEKLRKNGVYIIEDVSNKYIKILQENFKKHDIDIVVLSSNYKKFYADNNLIVIKKT